MAKEQNLNLNSLKISGMCGRLLCCLGYEYETYRDLSVGMPVPGTEIICEDVIYNVISADVLKQTMKIKDRDRLMEISKEDIERRDNTFHIRKIITHEVEDGEGGGGVLRFYGGAERTTIREREKRRRIF
jgi:cell fate regulator YaaT (PSP1 superfamily)